MEILKSKNISKYSDGTKIHIKEKNKGKFTEYCNGEVTQDCIDKAKNSGNPTLKKRAIFAENVRSWKHAKGGQLIPKHKTGYFLDYDPNNPYHVHSNGEKVVIDPEQYEKHKDEPYFSNIRKQVEEHQAAYPKPEYTETSNPEYRRVYANVKAASNQHFKEHNINGKIYREYSTVPEPYFRNSLDGVVTDNEGNLYRPMTQADVGKGVTPVFTNKERGHNGRYFDMSWVRVKTPEKTIKILKQPLPVDRTYNVDEDLNNSVNEYIKNNTGYYNNIGLAFDVNAYPEILKITETFHNKGRKSHSGKLLSFDEGTLSKQDYIKTKKLTGSESYGIENYDEYWTLKSPTKQDALNNIQLKIN